MTTPKQKASDIVKAILIALFAALILRQFVLASYNVPTGSMKDTILVGDFMFVNKFVYGARSPVWIGIPFTDKGFAVPYFSLPAIIEPKRNDIIVFDWPNGVHLDYIKRCVAVGGQTVELKRKKLYVDGQPEGKLKFLKRKYDSDERSNINYTHISDVNGKEYVIRNNPVASTPTSYPLTPIPDDHFFMMGDNRDNSEDSRVWGFVRRDQIGGKPLMIWLSWDGNVPGYRFFDKVRWDRLGKVLK